MFKISQFLKYLYSQATYNMKNVLPLFYICFTLMLIFTKIFIPFNVNYLQKL